MLLTCSQGPRESRRLTFTTGTAGASTPGDVVYDASLGNRSSVLSTGGGGADPVYSTPQKMGKGESEASSPYC